MGHHPGGGGRGGVGIGALEPEVLHLVTRGVTLVRAHVAQLDAVSALVHVQRRRRRRVCFFDRVPVVVAGVEPRGKAALPFAFFGDWNREVTIVTECYREVNLY